MWKGRLTIIGHVSANGIILHVSYELICNINLIVVLGRNTKCF